MSKYALLTQPPVVLGRDNKLHRATLTLPGAEGVEIPNMWSSVRDVKDLMRDLKQRFQLYHSGTPDMDSYAWDVEDCLRFIVGNPAYTQHMHELEDLEIIIRGDGLPVGSRHASFLLLSLGNFGKLSKCLAFNFPINLAEMDEKNREAVRLAFQRNLDKLNKWSREEHVTLYPEVTFHVRVEWGGDESWLRMLLGLLSAKELLACIKCMWMRCEYYDPEARVDRVVTAFAKLHARGTADHQHAPLITEAHIRQIHHCGMHAISPFGKDLLQLSFDHLLFMAAAGVPLWEQAQRWIKQHRIHVDITYLHPLPPFPHFFSACFPTFPRLTFPHSPPPRIIFPQI